MKKKILSFLTALAVLATSVSWPSVDVRAEVTNVALNKNVTVSSVESAVPGNTGDQAVDGDQSTRWSCNAMKGSGATDATEQTPQWLIIDLQATATEVTELKIDFYLKVWSTKYRIETADTNTDSTEWSVVKEVERTSNDSNAVSDTYSDIGSLKRYVRFYFEKVNVNAGGTGVSIKEITINGTQTGILDVGPASAAAALSQITAPTLTVEDQSVPLPSWEGYDVKVIGSEKEQVISNDGQIVAHNIGDREVSIIVEVTSKTDASDTARKNITVTVPSKHVLDSELYPTVSNPNEKPVVIPSLQEWYGYEGTFQLDDTSRIVINDVADVNLEKVAQNMQEDLEEIVGREFTIVSGETATSKDIYIESLTTDQYEVGEEGYFTTIAEDGIRIYAHTYTGCLYGTITVEQILWQDDDHDSVPYGVVRDYPDYEIRGVMFDVGRIPHRLQYLQDYTKILTWYKMSEFHLHLNDDFMYDEDVSGNQADWTTWTGIHRLESDIFPSLTDQSIYPNNEYFNEDYQDPFYTKEEYRELEDLAKDGGIDLIAEFDTPSHSAAYIEYANENPDNIEWLGPINTTNTTTPTTWKGSSDTQMLALDVNSSNATEKANAENARKFIAALYDDYLGGENPTFTSDTVHIGADEYWDTSNTEAFRGYITFLAELMGGYGKTVRMWGSLKHFGSAGIPTENVVIDVWNSSSEEVPLTRIAEGFRVVNVPQPFLYTTPGRDHKDMIAEEYLYKNWDPTMFTTSIKADAGEPLLLGAKAALWGDEFREGITEADTHEAMLRAVAITAEKTWNCQTEEDGYLDYQMAFEELQEGPGTEIAHTIETESEVVADYNLDYTETTEDGIIVKDVSGNEYDATVTGGTLVEVDGETMIAFDGNTVMETPLTTLDYPYTVSFDVKASEGNDESAVLFSGYDGQLRASDVDGAITIRRSFYTQGSGYTIPTDKTVNVTIVGTYRNTKVYVDGQLVKMFSSTDTKQASELFTTFVFPMETIGENFHGYIGNIKAYNKALQADMIGSDTTSVTEVNVALNTEAYAERYGTGQGGHITTSTGGFLKVHQSWKAVDGNEGDAHSYWQSTSNANDYLFVDLGAKKTINRVAVTWETGYQAASFAIQISDDAQNWTTVETIAGNSVSVNEITLDTPVEAQYVKVQGITLGSNSFYRIREVEVFQSVDKSALKAQVAAMSAMVNADDFASEIEEAEALVEQVAYATSVLENPFTTTAKATLVQAQLEDAVDAYEANKPCSHVWAQDFTIDKEATCEAEGSKSKHCTVAGCTAQSEVTAIEKKAHTLKTRTEKATTSKNGYTEEYCTACSYTKKVSTIHKIKSVTVSGKVYNGKTQKATITVKDSNGNKIAATNYSVKYASGCKKVGKYKVTITFKGNYEGTVKKYFTISPKVTSFKTKKGAKKAISLTWKKLTKEVTGYEIQYATNKSFTKGKKTQVVKKNSTTSMTIKKLSAKKTYYVRIRTYKTVGKTKFYSSWSKVQKVKTK